MHTKIFFFVILFFCKIHSSFSQDVKVAVIGDFGAATLGAPHINNEAAVADLVKSWDTPNQPLDAILTVGDNNYPNGSSADIETNIGQFYGEYIQGHPNFSGGNNRFFPSIGNHDYGVHDCNAAGNPYPFKNYFNLPGNELYYDYVIGNVHFFVVDSDCHQTDGVNAWSTQAQWLETQMTNSPHPWKIVYFHHAPYSSTPAGNSGYLQWDFKEWGATAIIAGHYHIYERLQVDGLTYFVNGIGGNSLHNITTVLPYSQVRYNDKHGAMLISFSENEANFKLININHEVIDNYTITNNTVPNPGGSDCNSIVGHSKLGEFGGKGYFISNNTATSWEDARNKSVALGANLISIENQAEKDFIDPFISGNVGEQVLYIGLKKNNSNLLEWSSGEIFNLNNYNSSPLSGNSSSSENYGSIRKWNTSSAITSWGLESGSAYRKYILEKTCATNCSNQGGDSDGDGICDNEDCAIYNPNLPAPQGSVCNDNNANTINDVIQADGCTCLGEFNNTSGNTCDNLPNFTKLSEFNGKGYYRSNFKAKGWEDAQVQSLIQDGYLISIENEAEKNFINQYITGTEDQVMYIGLRKNNSGIFQWTSGEILNLNNFNSSPWEGGVNPSGDNFGTIRKWNPNNPAFWGTESGGAYRKFILEKTCALDCSNDGGDSDNDGICNSQDCAPNDANFPMPFGTPCNDNNPNTTNDIIGEDGCNCIGEPILTGNFDCNNIVISSQSQSLTIENIDAPIAIIKIYDPSWNKIFECNNNCASTITQSNLETGTYHIDIQLFDATWNQVCSRSVFISVFQNFYNVLENNVIEEIKFNNASTLSEFDISTYPNPVQDQLILNFSNKNRKINAILIYDNSGKLIQNITNINNIEDSFTVDTKNLIDGIYIVNVEINGESSISKKIVVKH